MDIILKERLNNGIGINTGNKVINFLFTKNTYIPCKIKYNYNIFSLFKKNHVLEFYFGDNLLSNYNILFYKIVLPTNTLLTINAEIISNLLIIHISSKICIYDTIVYNLYNEKIDYVDVNNENIQTIKLHYELYNCIENIKYKLNFMNIDNNIKLNIISKLENLYENKNNYENLQIMKKISELKNKFII